MGEYFRKIVLIFYVAKLKKKKVSTSMLCTSLLYSEGTSASQNQNINDGEGGLSSAPRGLASVESL